jgi:hypothetical protein
MIAEKDFRIAPRTQFAWKQFARNATEFLFVWLRCSCKTVYIPTILLKMRSFSLSDQLRVPKSIFLAICPTPEVER